MPVDSIEPDKVLTGTTGADKINGDGSDILFGGLGNDELNGGADADTFVFTGTINNDDITDFKTGTDTIEFIGYGPMSAADVLAMISQSGVYAVLDLWQNGSVTLEGVDMGDLSLADFGYILDDIFVVG